jgi:hypothetical protein
MKKFDLDLTRHFDPSKKAAPPPPAKIIPLRPVDQDALHDYDEVGSKCGTPVDIDWDRLLANLDFTKNKWWLLKTENDECGELRIRVIELPESMIDGVLRDFIDFSNDPIQARQQRVWVKRMFREYDSKTFRRGKDERFKHEPPSEPKPGQLDLL